MDQLLYGYAALVHPPSLSFPSHLPFSDVHGFLVDSVLLHPLLTAYPPSNRYQRAFWKWAIHHLENMLLGQFEDVEVDSRIYTHYMSLLPPSHAPAVDPPAQSYITHFLRFPADEGPEAGFVSTQRCQTVTLLESRTTIEGGTTGLRTWPASVVLSHYLISHQDFVASRRVLELGSGTGFLGIVVAALQHFRAPPLKGHTSGPSLWMSDVNEAVLARCRDNLQLPCNMSSAHANINYCLLDWSFVLDPNTRPRIEALLDEIDPELILGADLVFDPTVLTALIGVLCLALRRRSTTKLAIMALTIRNEETFANFIRTAEASLVVKEIARDDKMSLGVGDCISGMQQEVKIFRITHKVIGDI